MLKDIGRLDIAATREIDDIMNKVFKHLDNGDKEKAEKVLFKHAKSPNYFVREYMGQSMARYSDQRKTYFLAKKMIKHRFYGLRATALFYFYTRYKDDPDKVLSYLEDSFETVPWESESIINELWKNHPDQMKKSMMEWIKSDNEKKRALSFHGMENIAEADPVFIMDFINQSIDDSSVEVQKKITHILTQVARTKPAECYPFIHEWLLSADDQRLKTLWVSMKKLANIVIQKSRRDKTQEFIMLTERTIEDWKNDLNKNVASVGSRLYGILQRQQ